MGSQIREFLKFAIVPVALLAVFLIYIFFYQLLDFPSPGEWVNIAENYYQEYGYWVILLGAIAEGTIFINWYLPGSTVVVLGVIFAGNDIFKVIFVVSLVTFGFFITTILNYIIGRYGWYRLFLKLGLKKPLEKMKIRVEKYGLPIIFGTYFHPGVGALTAASCGILKLSLRRFFLYSLFALIIWNSFWGIIVYFSGSLFLNILNTKFIVPLLAVWIVFLAAKFFKNRSKKINL